MKRRARKNPVTRSSAYRWEAEGESDVMDLIQRMTVGGFTLPLEAVIALVALSAASPQFRLEAEWQPRHNVAVLRFNDRVPHGFTPRQIKAAGFGHNARAGRSRYEIVLRAQET